MNRLAALAHIPGCATEVHIADQLNRPTSVYLMHLPGPGLYKVGIGVDASRRVQSQRRNGRPVTTLQVVDLSYKRCAMAVEAIVLNLTEPWRTIDDRWRSDGPLECWSDDGTVPDLREIAERFNPAIIRDA